MIKVLAFMGGLGCLVLAFFLWVRYERQQRLLPGQHPSDLKPYPWPRPDTGKPTMITRATAEIEAEEDAALAMVIAGPDLDQYDQETLEKANRAELRARLRREREAGW